ncbi:MAG: esterase family protein [Clostridia bacterium]|nr:esterase family protein [Clostridia bacterium]
MAILDVHFRSDVLGLITGMKVVLPVSNTKKLRESKNTKKCKVGYLLHGMSDDYTAWVNNTSIVRYAEERNIAIIMPNADLSWYTDMYIGNKYYEFMTEELPAVCRTMFGQLSDKREDTFIAGLSMGGYGTLKIAMNHPERFAACAPFSGAFDVVGIMERNPDNSYWKSLFKDAETVKGSKDDVYAMIEKCAKTAKELPRVYMWCGLEDTLIDCNRKARDLLKENGFEIEYSETHGNHSWFYWDREIVNALDFFLKKK